MTPDALKATSQPKLKHRWPYVWHVSVLPV